MRCRPKTSVATVACLAVAATTFVSSQPLPLAHTDNRVVLLKAWMEAVQRHEPGMLDSALITSSTWSPSDLGHLRNTMQALFLVVNDPKIKEVRIVPAKSGPHDSHRTPPFPRETVFRDAVLEELRSLAAHVRKLDVNTLLKRGTLFHTDVVALGVDVSEIAAPPESTAAMPFRIQIEDGQLIGVSYAPAHWDLARLLIDHIQPKPSSDLWAVEWYRATTAYLQGERQYYDQHLDRALALFPADAQLQFLAGCQHEVLASATVQSFVRNNRTSRLEVGVQAEGRELIEAERFLTRAIELQTSHVEARVHLGRILSLRGRHKDGAEHLRAAIAARPEPLLEFYAALFLGSALGALQDRSGAQNAYSRAIELYPRSQAANLALAELAWTSGERDAMRARLQQALASGESDAVDDPWRAYQVAHGRGATAALDAIRAPFRRD